MARSWKTFVACRILDVGATIFGLNYGIVELNSIVGAVLSHGCVPFVGMETVVTVWICHRWEVGSTFTKVGLNMISLIVVLNNAAVLATNV